jgi:hypothetical protein
VHTNVAQVVPIFVTTNVMAKAVTTNPCALEPNDPIVHSLVLDALRTTVTCTATQMCTTSSAVIQNLRGREMTTGHHEWWATATSPDHDQRGPGVALVGVFADDDRKVYTNLFYVPPWMQPLHFEVQFDGESDRATLLITNFLMEVLLDRDLRGPLRIYVGLSRAGHSITLTPYRPLPR